MIRFIVLSFGFLGWAFYEMSGGAEFDGAAIRAARLADAASKPVITQQTIVTKPEAVVVAQAPKVVIDTDPPLDADVTRVSLNLTTLGNVGDENAPQNDSTAVPQNVNISNASADTPAIIPSLIDPTDGQSVAVSIPTSAASDDIRTVSGNRVNVRGGPGTDFGIVARLVRGDAVRIIQDDGNGWVRFETLDGDTDGWMADFLLTSG
ncbi:SH3 domain-containing protein [Sulfitobacter sp. F26204]|uniref:SH3 domain-containing protein n=1 Tax=Sulfitobacter sp. F26204 TaxID=2996014 RepID=UPI00225E304F|nr:SH3 domain-containing protein [Sulfitobacter sp. F26204]MCX7561911.1 SH3 domain-containing protein [Sulfitobacter sp. F26204]